MRAHIPNVTRRSATAILAFSLVAILLMSLGPVMGLPSASKGTVIGTVTDAGTGDAIEGALVTISYHGITRSDTTDDQGKYRFTNVPECYCLKNVTATAKGYLSESQEVGVYGITVVDFALERDGTGPSPLYGRLSGTVTDAVSGDPIAGATVTLAYHDVTRTDITDPDGSYTFDEVPICFCMKDLSVEADGYVGQERQVAVDEDTVEDFALERDGEEPVPSDGRLSGTVTDADNGGPVAGATVTLAYHDVIRTEVTGSDGSYAFDDVPTCRCYKDLSVEADGYVGEDRQVSVHEDTVEDFALEPEDDGHGETHGTVSGIVTDAETGLPVAGAEVTLAFHDETLRTWTDANGLYVIDGVPICFCMKDLSVEADGYVGVSLQIAVGEQTVQDVELEPEEDGTGAQPGIQPGVTGGRDDTFISREDVVLAAGLTVIAAGLGIILFLVFSTGRRDRPDD
jgi:hypothetical protein